MLKKYRLPQVNSQNMYSLLFCMSYSAQSGIILLEAYVSNCFFFCYFFKLCLHFRSHQVWWPIREIWVCGAGQETFAMQATVSVCSWPSSSHAFIGYGPITSAATNQRMYFIPICCCYTSLLSLVCFFFLKRNRQDPNCLDSTTAWKNRRTNRNRLPRPGETMNESIRFYKDLEKRNE